MLQDLRYALRQLLRNPGFSLVATLSLALGIGANTAIFGLIDQVMLRLLPVRNPAELTVVGGSFSYPRYADIRDRNQVFSSLLCVHRLAGLTVVRAGQAQMVVTGELVSGNYFTTLGVNASLGRTIVPADDSAPESSPVAVISHGYWQRAFAGSADVLGKQIRVRSGTGNASTGGLDIYDGPGTRSLDGALLTIVGVAPAYFFGDTVGTSIDVWIPMMMQGSVMPGRPWLSQRKNVAFVNIMGRRKPSVTEDQTRAAISVLWSQILIDEESGKITEERRKRLLQAKREVEPGAKGFSRLRRDFATPLLVLMTVVGLVLLIGCLNIANLLLARATARGREIGIRLSLGAGRSRLIRQLLTESLVLALAGGALGLAVAYIGTRVLVTMVSSGNETIDLPFRVDFQMLGFTAAISLLTGVFFGLAPALRATRISLADTLKEAGRSAAGSYRAGAARLLVTAQVAVSLMLLIGAALFLRTLYNLKSQDVGYNPDHLVLMRVDPVSAGYRGDDVGRVCKNILDRVARLPGVRAATFSENGLFSGTESGGGVDVEGFTPSGPDDRNVLFDQIGPGYFTNIGIPILLGRDMSERDLPGAPRVVIINDTMAKFYFHGGNPIGKHVKAGQFLLEIVGVVHDATDHDFHEPAVRRYYVSYFQPIDGITTANFEIRTMGNPVAVLPALRTEVQAVNRNLSVLSIKEVKELMDASVVQERLIAKLAAFFGFLAVALAAIGLYGVMSYGVSRRTNEIGLRMALGARGTNVIGMILREVLALIAAGLIVGIAAAGASTRLVKSLLYGLTPTDPAMFVAAAAVLAVVGVLAGYFPARRAAGIDPMAALRHE
ncbi:MAG TPA: ABC transporter permease [Bryobacteraceae bacterium]|nr:ABC transporter permease [Bryobacteraceae bacterium]